MDIVIHPEHGEEPKPPGLFSSEGIARLIGLLSWLEARDCQADLYIVCPKGAPELAALLPEFVLALAVAVRGKCHFVVDISDARPDMLSAAMASGIDNLVLFGGNGHTFDEQAKRLLAAHREGGACEGQSISVWLAPEYDGHDLPRLREFTLLGLSPKVITEPLLPLQGAHLASARFSTLPAELLENPTPCDLYTKTITLDANGEMRGCPAHTADVVLGSIFEHSPEDLIYRKGWFNQTLAGSDLCRSCTVRGRHVWPGRPSEIVTRLFQSGEEVGEAARQPVAAPTRDG
jgi:hypothetical protein